VEITMLRFIVSGAAVLLWILPAGGAAAGEALASNPAAVVSGGAAIGSDQPIATVEGKNLIGREVTGAHDQPVGEIESVYVDAKGNVRQILVETERDHVVAIDWKDVMVSDSGRKIAVSAGRDRISKLPAYRYVNPAQRGTVFTDEPPSATQLQ
jgi:hypothetical protein